MMLGASMVLYAAELDFFEKKKKIFFFLHQKWWKGAKMVQKQGFLVLLENLAIIFSDLV